MGENVTFSANGGTANGYLASPPSGKGPGVIVIQDGRLPFLRTHLA